MLTYLFFGILTTAFNFAVYYALTRWANLDINIANILAIVSSILFAFITNKKFVFQNSAQSGMVAYLVLFATFFAMRMAAMAVDVGLFFLLTSALHLSDFISKGIIAFVIVVMNYITSKLFVFK